MGGLDDLGWEARDGGSKINTRRHERVGVEEGDERRNKRSQGKELKKRN